MVVDDINDEQSQAKSFDNICAVDLPAVCASIYHQILNRQGGTYDSRVDAIPSHRIRWMTEASFQPQGGLLTQQQEALLP